MSQKLNASQTDQARQTRQPDQPDQARRQSDAGITAAAPTVADTANAPDAAGAPDAAATEAVLDFFVCILKNMGIPCHVIPHSFDAKDYEFDFAFQKIIDPGVDVGLHLRRLLSQCEPNTIYRTISPFLCQNFFFLTPGDDPSYVMAGPFTEREVTARDIADILERYSLPLDLLSSLQRVYHTIPIVPRDSGILALVNTLGEKLWGGMDRFDFQDVYHSVFFDLEPVARRPQDLAQEDAIVHMHKLEERYAAENRLLKAISQGQSNAAEAIMATFSSAHVDRLTSSPLHDLKRHAVVANALMRKAAEHGNVHPIHVESLSARFSRAIEDARSEEAVYRLGCEMARKYCLLVKNHSMRSFSPLVQKVLTRIDSDLSADLTLKTQAALLNVNASYLSGLFKREVGRPLTDYVNRKRVAHGIFLLNATGLQIQSIAEQCGIPDVNYFTRLFKKIVHMTPSEYRASIAAFPQKDGGELSPLTNEERGGNVPIGKRQAGETRKGDI